MVEAEEHKHPEALVVPAEVLVSPPEPEVMVLNSAEVVVLVLALVAKVAHTAEAAEEVILTNLISALAERVAHTAVMAVMVTQMAATEQTLYQFAKLKLKGKD